MILLLRIFGVDICPSLAPSVLSEREETIIVLPVIATPLPMIEVSFSYEILNTLECD